MERFESARLQLRNDIGPLTLPLFYVTSVLLLAVHVLGSLWFAVGDTEEGWVQEEELHTMPLSRQYTRSLEWALSKLPPSSLRLTVDLKTPGERWLGILGTCLALVCGSLFVSFVTNTMAGVARTSIRTKQVLRSVQKYCGLYGIPYAYSMQIRRYVEREHRRKELANHMNLLNDLPDGMVRELFQEARSQTLHHHAFFREVPLLHQSQRVQKINFVNVKQCLHSRNVFWFPIVFFPQQQNAMGSLHNIDFRVPGTGSGNWFREPFDGFRRVRFCSRGLDGTGSGNRVPGTKGIKKVPDSGDSVPKVPKVALYFESILFYTFESTSILSKYNSILFKYKSILSRFKSILSKDKKSILVNLESILLYLKSILLYFERILVLSKV